MLILTDWIKQGESIIALITAFVGLIGTGVGVFFSIKTFIKSLKEKSLNEIWKLLLEIADVAIKTAEESGKSGPDKKKLAIDIIIESAKAAGIDVTPFVAQLGDYIDQTIKFVNDLTK